MNSGHIAKIAWKLVTTPANGEQKPICNLTRNRQDTKGRSCACGVYFYRLDTPGFRAVKKAVVTR
jgi:hypothetical protein